MLLIVSLISSTRFFINQITVWLLLLAMLAPVVSIAKMPLPDIQHMRDLVAKGEYFAVSGNGESLLQQSIRAHELELARFSDRGALEHLEDKDELTNVLSLAMAETNKSLFYEILQNIDRKKELVEKRVDFEKILSIAIHVDAPEFIPLALARSGGSLTGPGVEVSGFFFFAVDQHSIEAIKYLLSSGVETEVDNNNAQKLSALGRGLRHGGAGK